MRNVPAAHVHLQQDHDKIFLHFLVHGLRLFQRSRASRLSLFSWGREGSDQSRPRLQIRPLPNLLRRLRRDDLPTERAIRFGGGGVVEVVYENREG